ELFPDRDRVAACAHGQLEARHRHLAAGIFERRQSGPAGAGDVAAAVDAVWPAGTILLEPNRERLAVAREADPRIGRVVGTVFQRLGPAPADSGDVVVRDEVAALVPQGDRVAGVIERDLRVGAGA